MQADYLFLHGGPGMSAVGERAWYGDSLRVAWWDQPRELTLRPYATLVGAARARLHVAVEARGAPVGLLAHSFGAQVALELAKTDAPLIGALVLLAPAHDMRHVWLTLAGLVDSAAAAPAVRAAAARYAAVPDETKLCALLDALAAVPNLFDHYWASASGAHMTRHRRILAEHPAAFDFPVFKAILLDFLRGKAGAPPAIAQDTAFPVHLLYGTQDRIVDCAAGLPYWRKRFSHASVKLLPCGHFIQFELALDEVLVQAGAAPA
jgi:pimeloyl-ACP methyl ester carboxylesterase